MQTGFITIDGSRYYFNNEGVMQFKWQKIDDKSYYFGRDGKMFTGIMTIDSEKYYFDKTGVMQTGIQTIDGNIYYFDADGRMSYEWQECDGKKYYFGKNGQAVMGWQTIEGIKYYFDERGVMSVGWKTIGNEKYYFGAEGEVKTGWQIIEGQRYYFSDNGCMAVNTIRDGYNIDENGKASEFTEVQKRAESILDTIRRNAISIYNYVRKNNTYKYIEYCRTLSEINEKGWGYFANYAMGNRYITSYYFAALQDILFHQAGYESRIVYGTAGNGDYYWNQVKTDGVWVNYDACGGYSNVSDIYLKSCGYIWYEYVYPKYY